MLVVEPEDETIRPAATWFASDRVRRAVEPMLTRPYSPRAPGVPEAAIADRRPVLIERLSD